MGANDPQDMPILSSGAWLAWFMQGITKIAIYVTYKLWAPGAVVLMVLEFVPH